MTDVRERHERVMECAYDLGGAYIAPDHCDYCESPWPCDAIQQADRADKAEADRDRMRAMVHEADESRNRAVRDAKAAEAIAHELRLFARHDNLCEFTLTEGACSCGFDAALARYDAEYPA